MILAVANYKSKAEVIARVENFFGNTPVIQKRPRHLSPENDKTTKQARVQEKKKRSELCENNKGDNSEKDEDPLFQCDEELEASILQTDNVGVFKTSVLSSEEKDKSDTSGSNASGKKSVINSKKVGPSSIIAKEKSFDTSKKQLKQNAKETYSTPKKKDESFLESSYHFNSEQKKKSNEAYQRYLHRSGPKNPGSKEIPEVTEIF